MQAADICNHDLAFTALNKPAPLQQASLQLMLKLGF